MSAPDEYASLRTRIKEIFTANQRRYGYRSVHAVLENEGMTISEKVVRKIMVEE